MTILIERATWRKPRTQRAVEQDAHLEPEEVANVRRALCFLRTRCGGATKLAAAMKVGRKLVERACGPRGRPSAGLAVRAARLAKARVDDVLSGAWPPDGACPYCGRASVG